MIESIALRIQNLKHIAEWEKLEATEKLNTDLGKAISLLDCQKTVVEDTIKTIREILSLPIWKKRHELYSVWVCTQIVDALKDFDIKFHVDNGTLSFSFAGSHIATCNGMEPPLHIWAELNTPYATPISKQRSSHIQPDYSLVVEDPKDPKNSVAVVECKQYKKNNRKNFIEAVTDYARGRPNANVLLVNYNEIPGKVKVGLAEDIKPRVPFFDRLKPLAHDGASFQAALKESVLSWYGIGCAISAPFDIIFSWGEKPRDLDLHLRITESSGSVSWVNYQSTKKRVKTAEIALDHDDRDGYGKETISVTDEPAEVLLDRIRTEKQRLVKEGKIKKDKQESVIFRRDNSHYEKLGEIEVCLDDEIPFELPENWCWVRLNDLCVYIQRGKSPKYSLIKKYPVIAQKCNQWSGFSIEKAQFIEPETINSYAQERLLQDGDLLWNSTGLGTLGRMAIYRAELNPYELAVADSHVTVIRPLKNMVLSEYLYTYFSNPTVQSVIEEQSDGSTKQKELATSTVKKYYVPLPPLSEQKRIVAKIKEIMPLVKGL